jgi:hypothetical protein
MVVQIDFPEHIYVQADNVDFDGDSNGTSLVANRPVQPTVSVADLDGASSWISSSAWDAVLTIAIVDNNGAPVANGTVLGAWEKGLSGTTTCVTDEIGLCTIPVPSVADSINEIEWEVTGIDHWLLLYEDDHNGDPDGDSDGEEIKIRPPQERPAVSIADLDGVSSWISSSAWDAALTIAVVDEHGAPVIDATVHGHWRSGLSGDTVCITDATGSCQIYIPAVPDTEDKIEWEALAIDHALRVYDDDDNDDPDNDSDGTKIKIEPPEARPAIHLTVESSAQWLADGQWEAAISFLVLDDGGAPVADANVTGYWERGLSGDVSCMTDASGHCMINGTLASSAGEAKLRITQVEHSLLVDNYDYADQVQVRRPQ